MLGRVSSSRSVLDSVRDWWRAHLRAILTYVLAGTTSATTTCGGCSDFAVGALGVFLLNVRVESWVTQVGLWTVAALEVTSFNVVLRAALAFAASVAIITTIVLVVVVFAIVSWLSLTSSNGLHLDLVVTAQTSDHVRRIAGWQLATGLPMGHHELTRAIVHVAHVMELVVAIAVPIGTVSCLLVDALVLAHDV